MLLSAIYINFLAWFGVIKSAIEIYLMTRLKAFKMFLTFGYHRHLHLTNNYTKYKRSSYTLKYLDLFIASSIILIKTKMSFSIVLAILFLCWHTVTSQLYLSDRKYSLIRVWTFILLFSPHRDIWATVS